MQISSNNRTVLPKNGKIEVKPRTDPGTLQKTIRDNMNFIENSSVVEPESPQKWAEAVKAAKTFLVQPGTQGKNPAGKLYVSQGDKENVSFVTMHQRWFTRVRPFPSIFNFVQWPGDESPKLQQRVGEDDFMVLAARTVDQNTVVTLGAVPGSRYADHIVTIYEESENQWDGNKGVFSIPDLSERGVSPHPAGGYQFDEGQWDIQLRENSPNPVLELRESFRNETGHLVTPEEPTALLAWTDGALVWQSKSHP